LSRINTRIIIKWSIIITVIGEIITLLFRLVGGISAVDFNKTNPNILLQVHHMFWAIPFIIWAFLIKKNNIVKSRILGLSIGIILSDLVHHFILLPLLVGNTGWHWP
jgi:uncharacterized membrane protein YwzB